LIGNESNKVKPPLLKLSSIKGAIKVPARKEDDIMIKNQETDEESNN